MPEWRFVSSMTISKFTTFLLWIFDHKIRGQNVFWMWPLDSDIRIRMLDFKILPL